MDDTLTVTRNDDAGRYEIHVGDVLGGYTEFQVKDDGRLIFPHTQIDPAFKGKGLGTTLVAEAMKDVASRGETITPLCPFVRRYVRENEVAGLTIEWPIADEAPASGGGGV